MRHDEPWQEPSYGNLPTRAVGVLWNLGITTKAQAKDALLNGKLSGRRACGKKTFNDIAEWVGLPKPYPRCPTCGGPITHQRSLELPR